MRNRLRVLRAERRWSQADLAQEVGVSRQTINALEIEKYDPSLPLAYKIARLFELPVEEIFIHSDAVPGAGKGLEPSELAGLQRRNALRVER
jgi:putative transcriptional regulator